MSFEAKSIYIHCETFVWYHRKSKPRGATHRNRLKFRRDTTGQFISIYFSLFSRNSGPYFIPPYSHKPLYGTHVWCLNFYIIYTAKMFPLPKLVHQKCIVDPDIAQFKSKDLGEKTTLAVSEQCTSQGSLRNRQEIDHTPHFLYPAFSIQPLSRD